MNRKSAKEIAQKITNNELKQMLDNAQNGIKDWTKTSRVNKGITKGTAWNILGKDFDLNHSYHILAKTNMVREFGDFLPGNLKPERKPTIRQRVLAVHQEPDFNS